MNEGLKVTDCVSAMNKNDNIPETGEVGDETYVAENFPGMMGAQNREWQMKNNWLLGRRQSVLY